MTKYAIRRTTTGTWWAGTHWTSVTVARQLFDFMTTANYVAIALLELGLDEFDVEPV